MKTATQFKLIGSARSAVKAALLIAALASFTWVAVRPAFSQAGTGAAKVYTPWSKQGKLAAGISVTGTSAATALPSVGLSAWICNTGANDAYLEFGSSGVAATAAAGTWLKSATCATYDLYPVGQASRYGYVAAITATSTTTLTVETGSGQGPDQLVASGGGGGGGAVTMASGAVASGAYSAGSLAAGSMVDLLTMRQTVAAGTAASNSLLTGGIYNSTPITLTNGQGAANQFDANGYLKVNVAAGGAGGGAVTIASGAVASGAYSSGSIASGAFASGAIGSGAIASGAFASGAVGSGAYASGAFAAGAGADGWDVTQGTKTESACVGDNTSGCSVQQRLQRIAQNISTLNTTASTGTGTPGSAVPSAAIYFGGNVAGNLRGWTGSNPTGSVYSQQVDMVAVNGTTVPTGTGAGGSGVQRVTPSNDTAAGLTPVKSSVPVVNGGNTYNTIAASVTAQALTGGGGGATGDYLSHCVLQPTTTGAATATISDNSTVIFTFTGGTLSNLAPIPIPIGAVSVSGAWKITTGANETMTCFGKFT